MTTPRRTGANKVPEITALFWVIKILTTGFGESFSDWLDHGFGVPPIVVIGGTGAVTAACAIVQFRMPRYRPWAYWTLVTMIAVFGTMFADSLRVLGLSLPQSTAVFIVLLAAVFGCWYRCEHTLSIHDIDTPRRETFYWTVVSGTFILGTVAGDLTAGVLGWGYFPSAAVFAVAIAVPALAHRYLGLSAVTAFWAAYVVTRPLGASLADGMGLSHHDGLGWGTGAVSLLWAAVIALVLAASTISSRRVTVAPEPVDEMV